jgi:hypothetical protein
MKQLILIVLIVLNINAYAQEDKTVTLVVSGQGKTQDEAKQNALRSAIEQAFGTFISSKTELINDSIIKDEIVSVANGNIQKFEIISEVQIPNGGYATSLKATVSVTKLTSFVESKGVIVEFKGGLFAMNMALQEFYEKNEVLAWEKTKTIIYEIMKKGFDYKIDVKQPIKSELNKYAIEIDIDVSMNKNYTTAINFLIDFCKSISLNETGAKEYISLQKEIYPIIFPSKEITYGDVKIRYQGSFEKKNLNKKITMYTYFIRNRVVANEILLTPWKLAKQAIYNFSISNGLDSIEMENYLSKNTIEISESDQLDNSKLSSFKEINAAIKKRYKGYVLTDNLSEYWQLFGRTTDGGDFHVNANFGGDYLSSIFNEVLIDPEKMFGYNKSGNQNPAELLPIVNFIGIVKFLHIHFFDKRDINEIKRITEYKIQTN